MVKYRRFYSGLKLILLKFTSSEIKLKLSNLFTNRSKYSIFGKLEILLILDISLPERTNLSNFGRFEISSISLVLLP